MTSQLECQKTINLESKTHKKLKSRHCLFHNFCIRSLLLRELSHLIPASKNCRWFVLIQLNLQNFPAIFVASLHVPVDAWQIYLAWHSRQKKFGRFFTLGKKIQHTFPVIYHVNWSRRYIFRNFHKFSLDVFVSYDVFSSCFGRMFAIFESGISSKMSWKYLLRSSKAEISPMLWL